MHSAMGNAQMDMNTERAIPAIKPMMNDSISHAGPCARPMSANIMMVIAISDVGECAFEARQDLASFGAMDKKLDNKRSVMVLDVEEDFRHVVDMEMVRLSKCGTTLR